MHLHVELSNIFSEVIILEPKEPEIVPVVLPDPKTIKHLHNIDGDSH